MNFRILIPMIIIIVFIFLFNSLRNVKLASSIGEEEEMNCSPDTVYKGDTISIEMSIPHGGYLGIITPNGDFFFVCWSQRDKNSPLQPLIQSEEFVNVEKIELITDKTLATPWIYGAKSNELIFTNTGEYRILMGENLETDSDVAYQECKIFYFDKPRE
ncbi:MAG: hypothetical protein D6732_09285 [Methanobacteriota archaeon]|nr:MAG: hypothetical protein D6732_09285 [Euryarchaeota archaeon]